MSPQNYSEPSDYSENDVSTEEFNIPHTADMTEEPEASPGEPEKNLPAEFSNVPFTRGIVGMARTSDPNSANSQFFIMFAEGSSLNGKYTVIGEVVSGMDVVDKLKRGEPVADPDKMVKVQVASDIK